jgi:hypothetical protein
VVPIFDGSLYIEPLQFIVNDKKGVIYMSLCLILMTADQLIIGGDSRACRRVDGIEFAVDDNVQKLHEVDGKAIFFGGLQVTGEQIIKEVSRIKNASIDMILGIAKHVVNDFKAKNPDYDAGGVRLTDVTVACFEDGRPVVYNFSDYENFEVKKIESTDHLRIITAGSHWQQAQFLADKLTKQMEVIPMYEYIYSGLASEEMGGTLYLCVIDNRGIVCNHISKITDQRPVRKVDAYNHCTISQANGIQIFDELSNERYKAGYLGGGLYGMYLKNKQGIKTVNISSNGDILNGVNEPITYYIQNTQAYYITTCANANSNLIIFAKADGIAGSYCYIRYVNPGVSTASCSVATTGTGTSGDPYYITVTLKHSGAAITATANEVAYAINYLGGTSGHPNIWADLIANVTPSDGTGVVAAFGYQQLTGYSQGSDSNDGLTVDTPLLTLTKLWEIVPSEINDTVIIKYLTGHYTVSSGNTISKKYGTGKIIFQPYTNNYVTIGNATDGWDITQCTLSLISFSYVCIRGRMNISYINSFNLDNCKSYMGTPLYYALSFSYVNSATVSTCTFTDCKDIIYSYLSTVLSSANSGNANRYGLYARAGTICKNGTQPTGNTANEFVDYGGEIR